MQSFFDGMQSEMDKALCSIWPKINELLPQELQKTDLKDAAAIREYINFFEVQEVLSAIEVLDLRQIKLGNCKLKVIPPEVENFIHLKELRLGNHQIEFIPKLFLQSLKRIDLLGNKIKFADFSEAINLEVIDLLYNQISIIPDSISKLNKLKSLYLTGNCIKNIPN